MAVGKSILMAVDGDAADLVLESQCGTVTKTESPGSIANAAIMLMNSSKEESKQMADNSRRY
jgi:colanic acid biosynthesis glycosyl transferase WcaI